MLISRKALTLLSTKVILLMFLQSVSWGNCCSYSLCLFGLLIAALHYFRFSQVDESKISDSILNLFREHEDGILKNTIFHKAGGSHAPENTMEAIEKAIELGVPSVEIDVEFTKDNVGVVIHGPTVDDTTEGSGLVSEHTFEELSKLNAATKDQNKTHYPLVRVPKLEDVLKKCVENNLVVFIDCKSNPAQTAKLIIKLYSQYPQLYATGVVCSFYPTIIYAVRKADPNILTALTHRNDVLTLKSPGGEERNKELWKRILAPPLDLLLSWAHWGFLWYICGNSFYLCSKDKISRDSKSHWSSLGIRLVAWTANDPLEKEFLVTRLGVPVITDGL